MLQEILRHASITATLDLYGHLYPVTLELGAGSFRGISLLKGGAQRHRVSDASAASALDCDLSR
jgi:hypothetical protein